jgi:tripartite-type tricarboxylate transporter receptor subunit TctC
MDYFEIFPRATKAGIDLFAVRRRVMALSMLMLVGVTPAAAQNFPERPIRLVSPFAPGGGNDLVSRMLAQALSKNLGQSVVVDNRPGATTMIGMELVAKAPADGYTLVMSSSTLAINVTLYPQLPYDVLRDFAPVSLVATTPLILAVHPSQPVTTVAELIALAKARPGERFFPSAGTGDAPHLAAELFNMTAGVKLMHVPYKGAAIGINDLVAGRLALMFGTSPATLQHVRSGRLRAIAVTSRTRTAVMPELPTVTESGLAGYEAGSWYGMLAPARTPKAVVARLAAAVSAAIASNDLSEKLKAQGVDVIGNTPAQFNTYIRQEIVKWAKVMQAAGISAGAVH